MHGPTCAHLHKAHEGEQGIIANPASLAAAGYVVLSGVNLACERLQRVQHVARRRFAGHGGRLFGRVGPEHAAAVFLFRPPHGGRPCLALVSSIVRTISRKLCGVNPVRTRASLKARVRSRREVPIWFVSEKRDWRVRSTKDRQTASHRDGQYD